MTNGSGVGPKRSGSVPIVFPLSNTKGKIVIPPAKIGSSNAVRLINNTGGLVRLWIPKGDSLFKPLPGGQDFNDLVIGDGKTLELDVLDTPANGDYPYHVYCDSVGDYAEGGSPPNMSCP